MVSWRPFPRLAMSRRAFTVSLVQLSYRRYQPRGVCRGLPWRVARRRSGSLTVAGVGGGCPVSRGVWRVGLSRSGASTLMCAWSWAGLAGLHGARWSPG